MKKIILDKRKRKYWINLKSFLEEYSSRNLMKNGTPLLINTAGHYIKVSDVVKCLKRKSDLLYAERICRYKQFEHVEWEWQ